MAQATTNDVTRQLLAVLREGVEGPPDSWSYFTDSGPESALFATLAKVSAAEASRPCGGSSIAAHAHHTAFGMMAAAAWIRGDHSSHDWKESWSVPMVDDAGWAQVQDSLRQRYGDLRQAIEAYSVDSAEAVGGAIGAIAHIAYHLGAIRQKIGSLKKS